MNNKFNLFEESPNFSDIYDFSSDFPQEISNENETPSLSNSLSDIKYEDFNSDIPPKKNLFKTKKIKTSFVVFKFPLYSHKKNETKNNLSNGRWTRQERIKFCEAIYHYGTDWKKLNEYITTRNLEQLRSHAQKFLIKLKCNEFIAQKGLNLKNMNWQQSIEYLREKLTAQEFLELLYSIETEVGDNNRMTEKYLERKRRRLNKNNLNNSNNHDESLNSSSNSTCDEFNIYIDLPQDNLFDYKNEGKNINNCINLLPLEENEENHLENNIYKSYYTNKNNIFLSNEIINAQSKIEENIYHVFPFEKENIQKYRNQFDFIEI